MVILILILKFWNILEYWYFKKYDMENLNDIKLCQKVLLLVLKFSLSALLFHAFPYFDSDTSFLESMGRQQRSAVWNYFEKEGDDSRCTVEGSTGLVPGQKAGIVHLNKSLLQN